MPGGARNKNKKCMEKVKDALRQEAVENLKDRDVGAEIMDKKVNAKIEVEYCGACDYGGHCLALAKLINERNPNANVFCRRGRQGSFEVVINDKLVYSKLRTMALPDYDEIVDVVNDVTHGLEAREIIGQQPINCVLQ